MNLERLRWGEWIAGIAGLDLLLVTFRSWYKVTGTGAHVTAWDALHSGRYLLLATAVVGIFLFLIQASEDGARLSFPPGWIAAVVGFICTVYVGYRLASPPSDALDPDVGIYIGLAGALGVTLGGLLSAREASALAAAPIADETPVDTGPQPDTIGGLVPDTGTNTWSPASPMPAPSTSGWSPASAAVAAVPPATAAGAGLAEEERPLRPGEKVTLTAGGARFPAGTVADVVEVFGGGALVEVKAPDGVAERFEVPESAFERGISAPPTEATSPSTGGERWSPAMPAAAGAVAEDDWGFDEPGDGASTATDGADAPAEKVPWYKREIGGGKKKKAEMAAAAGAGAAAAAIATHDGEADTAAEEKPSFFKRLFGGGAKQEAATEETAEVAPDEPVAQPEPESPTAEPDSEVPGPAPDPEPEPEPEAPEPEPVAEAAAAPEPDPVASAPEPDPVASAPEPDPVASPPEPEAASPPAPEPEAAATSESEPEAAASEPVPEAPAASESEPEAAAASESEPEAAAASAPETASAPEPEAAAPTAAPEAGGSSAEPASASPAADAESAAAGAAAGAAADEAAMPKRRRSSGSRKVPKEAVAAAASEGGPPKVGDEVQLKVSGGKFDAGTRGTVVDVFSAGVIVELSDNNGNTERLDLPFEAVGPADA